MSLEINLSGLDFRELLAKVDAATPEALAEGMEHIHQVSAEQTPVETGRLVGSGAVHVEGDEASLTYDGPYAAVQHERLDYRHEHGNAKYLEIPMGTEAGKALEIIAHRIQEAL